MRMLLIFAIVVGLLGALYGIGLWLTSHLETVESETLQPLQGGRFITTQTGRTHLIDVGEGPPILLLHGSGGSLAAWQEGTIDRLVKNHRVIAFDFFGNGFSERNASFSYGYTLWVDQAVELLRVLEIEHVTVIGHSVGGALACVLAADHPDMVDHVVTIGTGLTIEPQQFLLLVPGVGEIILANSATFADTKAERYRAVLEQAFTVRGTRAALLSYARRQATVDGLRLVQGVFEDIRAPVLHVSGTLDAHIPHETARALSARTKGRFVAIEGAGHDVHIDTPDQLVAAVEAFLVETPSVPSDNRP